MRPTLPLLKATSSNSLPELQPPAIWLAAEPAETGTAIEPIASLPDLQRAIACPAIERLSTPNHDTGSPISAMSSFILSAASGTPMLTKQKELSDYPPIIRMLVIAAGDLLLDQVYHIEEGRWMDDKDPTRVYQLARETLNEVFESHEKRVKEVLTANGGQGSADNSK